MTNTEATTAQVDYIRSLQEQHSYWRTTTPESDESIARQARDTWASRIRHGQATDLDREASEAAKAARAEQEAHPVSLAERSAARREGRSLPVGPAAQRLAEIEAQIGQQAVTERHATRAAQFAALDVDPTTLTKAEASSVIDALKGVLA